MYLVLELQSNEGVLSTIPLQYDTEELAMQKYYLILSAAVVSTIDCHAAVVMDPRGVVLASMYYEHNTEAD